MSKKNTNRRAKNLNIRAGLADRVSDFTLDVPMDKRVQQYVVDAALEAFLALPKQKQGELVLRQMVGDLAVAREEPPVSVGQIGPNGDEPPESAGRLPPATPHGKRKSQSSQAKRGRQK